jgi:transcriptional antiterminator NusG
MYTPEEIGEWYALFVKTGEEEKVKEWMRYQFGDRFKVLVPKRKLRERKAGVWHDTIRNLFPGYVLFGGEIDWADYYAIKNTPGILKFLRHGNDFISISDQEMLWIKKLTINGDEIGASDVFIQNDKVEIIDGPLMSMEGKIIEVNKRKGRVKVLLDFLGESRTIELAINIVQKA